MPSLHTDLLQQTELLQLPLVVQDEAVAARPPPGQVLLSSDVCHRGVQHTSATTLHAWGRTEKSSVTIRNERKSKVGGTIDSGLTWTSIVRHMAEGDLIDSSDTVTEEERGEKSKMTVYEK